MLPAQSFRHPVAGIVSRIRLGTLHAKAHTTTLLLTSTLLHLLANLDVDVEELGDTAVQADRLALVQVALAVVGGDALLSAGLGEAVDGKIG
jgi:D-aminopeptidase